MITLRGTKGSMLTHAELDANFTSFQESTGSSLVGFIQSGAGAVARTVQDKLSDHLSLKDYCALDGVTDDTAKYNLARADAASSGRALHFNAGDLLLTDEPAAIAGQYTMYGDGPFKSRIIFRPTANNKAAIKLSNGASRCERIVLRDFAIYSDDTTYTKIALDVYDLSVCEFDHLLIYGTGGAGPSAGACWSGNSNTSIGLRTHGREATGLSDIEIVADKPIVIAANPNTSANDGEDLDHWNFHNLYLVGNGNPLVTVDDGLGVNEVSFTGYQAWVGGTAGFKINDTRAAPTVPSRGLSFANIRHEQITDSAGYSFNLAFTVPIQNIGFEKVLMAAGGHGITITGFDRMVCNRVTAAMAAGKNSLVTAGVTANSVLVMSGCIWQSGSNVTLTGLLQIHAQAFNSINYAAPSDAVYAGQVVATQFNVAKGTITGINGNPIFNVTGTTGDDFQVIPQVAGSGVSVRSMNNAQSDFEPMAWTAESYDIRYRTGVATSAPAWVIDTAGQLSLSKRMFPAQDTGAGQTASGLFAGTGVPNNANGSNGDFYFRGDGTPAGNTIIYHKAGGVWVAAITS